MSNLKTILFYLAIATLFTLFFVNPQTYFPYIIGKATVFRIIVNIMLVIWAFWKFNLFSKGGDNKNQFSVNLLIKAIILFGIIIFIASLFGVDFNYSFFSSNERFEGVLGIWYFIAFFLILATSFDYLEIEKILKIQVFIGLFYSFLALIPFFKLGYVLIKTNNDRLIGLTGNPSFFAVYLIFNAFLALYFYFKEYNFNKKILNWWLLFFLVQSFLIFVTLTRGAMLGYLIGIILIALAIIFLAPEKNLLILKKIALFFIIGILAISIFAFAGKNTDFVKNNAILSRFSSISLTAPTSVSRLLSVGVAWKSFLQKPFFGWGQEAYEAAYVVNLNPIVFKYLPEDFYFDRVHNKPMEVLATNGIFGFLSYLAIFGIAFYLLNELRKKPEWFLPSLALIGCLISYFIQNMFIFDFHESYLMFFLTLAFISTIRDFSLHKSNNKEEEKIKKEKNQNDINKDFIKQMSGYLVMVIIICIVIYSTSEWIIKPYQVSKGIYKIGYLIAQDQGEQAIEQLNKILDHPCFLEDDIIIGVKNMDFSYGAKLNNKSKFEILSLIAGVGEQAIEKSPWKAGLIMTVAETETVLSQWDKNRLEKAKQLSEKMLLQFPDFPKVHLFAAKVLVLDQKYEQGIKEAQKAIEIDPKLAVAYYLLGTTYFQTGDLEQANKNLIKAAELNYLFMQTNQIAYVANLLVAEKDYQTIEKLYLRAIKLEPENYSWYINLAATYGKMRQKEKAIKYANKVLELNPEAKESVEEFIQLIENEQWDEIIE